MEKTKTPGRVSGFIRYTLNISSKQLWLLVLWSVFLMFVFPITMSMNANSYIRDISDRISYMMTQITTMLWYILPIPAFVFSHGFGYLNSRSKLDFYHFAAGDAHKAFCRQLSQRAAAFSHTACRYDARRACGRRRLGGIRKPCRRSRIRRQRCGGFN